MKKHFLLFAIIIGLSASMAFSMNSDPKIESENPAIPDKTENKLSEEEISAMITRAEEIRDMDKSNLTKEETRELKNELKATKKELKEQSPGIYIGGTALILIIILLIVLL